LAPAVTSSAPVLVATTSAVTATRMTSTSLYVHNVSLDTLGTLPIMCAILVLHIYLLLL
jgi:hypothetical protein